MIERDMFYYLNELASLVLKIANLSDRKCEKDNPYIAELGLGYISFSNYLRRGAKAIVDIQSEYTHLVSEKNLAVIGEDSARDFLEEVFGDREIETINEADKEKIKAFVKEIMEGWEE